MSVPFIIPKNTRSRIAPVAKLYWIRGGWVDLIGVDGVEIPFELGSDKPFAQKLSGELRGRLQHNADPALVQQYREVAVRVLPTLDWPGRRPDGKATILDVLLTHESNDTPETAPARHVYRREFKNIAQIGWRAQHAKELEKRKVETRQDSRRSSLREYEDILYLPFEYMDKNPCERFSQSRLPRLDYKSEDYIRTQRTIWGVLNQAKCMVGVQDLYHFRRSGLIIPHPDLILNYKAFRPRREWRAIDQHVFEKIFRDLANPRLFLVEAAYALPGYQIVRESSGDQPFLLFDEPCFLALCGSVYPGFTRQVLTSAEKSWLNPDGTISIPPGLERMPGDLPLAGWIWARYGAQPGPKLLGPNPDAVCDRAVAFARAHWFPNMHPRVPILQELVHLQQWVLRSKYDFWDAYDRMGYIDPATVSAIYKYRPKMDPDFIAQYDAPIAPPAWLSQASAAVG